MNFTYSQKKWAMTAVLLAVLGISSSFNPLSPQTFSTDFASNELVSQDVITTKGKKKVQFIKTTDNTTTAVTTEYTAEGAICTSCPSQTFKLDVGIGDANADNISKLQVAFLQKFEAQGKVEEKPAEKTEETVTKAEITPEEYTKKKLDEIEKSCSASDPSRVEQVACLSKAMSALMKDTHKIKKEEIKLDQAKLKEFVRTVFLPILVAQIKEGRQALIASNRPSYSRYGNIESDIKDYPTYEAEREKILLSLQALVQKVPSKYEGVRSLLVDSQVLLVRDESMAIQTRKRQADEMAKTNPFAASQMLNEVNFRMQDLGVLQVGLHDNLDQAFKDSLRVGGSDAIKSLVADNYINRYDTNTNQILQQMIASAYNYQLPAFDSNGLLIPGLQSSVVGNPRINSGNGRATVVGNAVTNIQPGSVIINPDGTRTVVPGTTSNAGNMVTVPNPGGPGERVIIFGNSQPISAENARLRDMNRNNPNRVIFK